MLLGIHNRMILRSSIKPRSSSIISFIPTKRHARVQSIQVLAVGHRSKCSLPDVLRMPSPLLTSDCINASDMFHTCRVVGIVQAFPSRGDGFMHDNSSMLQQNELITFITADGVVQIPGRPYYAPRKFRETQQPMPTWEEQLLCIGQTFQVAAWSKDPNRSAMPGSLSRC